MKKLAAKVAILSVALLAWGGVIAPSSQALNVYTTKSYFCINGGYSYATGWYNVWRIYDYNSWEESWLGGSHRDYKVFVGQYRDPSFDAYCRAWG
jgi:hypothetical protein